MTNFTPTRSQGWTRTPNRIIDSGILDTLSLCATRLYRRLERLANREGRCWPGLPLLGRLVKFSERTVWSAIRELMGAGLLEIARRGGRDRANVYQLIAPPPPPEERPTEDLPLFAGLALDDSQISHANCAQGGETTQKRTKTTSPAITTCYAPVEQNDSQISHATALRGNNCVNKTQQQDTHAASVGVSQEPSNAVAAFLQQVGMDATWSEEKSAALTLEEAKQARDYASKRAKGGFCGYLRRVVEGGWWKKVIKQAKAPASQAAKNPPTASPAAPGQTFEACADNRLTPEPEVLKRLPEASQQFFTRHIVRTQAKSKVAGVKPATSPT